MLMRRRLRYHAPAIPQGLPIPIKGSIPRTFHFIWLGPESLPAIGARCIESWRHYNPDYTVRLWRSEDAGEALQANAALYNHVSNLAEKSDILRYEILASQGGIYCDIDMECLQTIDPLLQGVTGFVSHYESRHFENAILGCVPVHPLFERARWGLADWWERHDGIDSPVTRTGPVWLTRCVKLHCGERFQWPLGVQDVDVNGLTLFGEKRFYPLPHNPGSRLEELRANPGGSFAVHHWLGSWK